VLGKCHAQHFALQRLDGLIVQQRTPVYKATAAVLFKLFGG
jgi:hypothetical protein